MLAKRIIPCLDINKGRVVKGVNFQNLKDAGDPVELSRFYNSSGADELCFLDITASIEQRNVFIDVLKQVANEVYIPLTVGGGISNLQQVQNLLAAGAEKVSLGTSAVQNPQLVQRIADNFGSQAVTISVDAKSNDLMSNGYEVYIFGGRTNTGLDAIQFALNMQKMGAGEILLNSIDKDGTRSGFELTLTQLFTSKLSIPVVASGGANSIRDFIDVFRISNADAALAASIFHSNEISIMDIKRELKKNKIPVRIDDYTKY